MDYITITYDNNTIVKDKQGNHIQIPPTPHPLALSSSRIKTYSLGVSVLGQLAQQDTTIHHDGQDKDKE